MTPEWVVLLMSVLTGAFLAAGVGLILWRGRCLASPSRWLLLAIVSLSIFVGESGLLRVAGFWRYSETIEDVLVPLLPTLWLFLFVVELERAERERAQRLYDRGTAVHNLALNVVARMEPRAVMDEVVEAASRLLGAPLAVLLMPDEKREWLLAQAARGITPEEMHTWRFAVADGLGGSAFSRHVALQTARPKEELAPVAGPIISRHGITNTVSVPLLFHGESVGVLNVGTARHRAFSSDDVSLLETLCANAAVAIENARLYERLVESEARYRLLVENAQAAIAVVDADRKIIFWNRGTEALLGWSAHEVLGRSIDLIYPPEHLGKAHEEILPAMEHEGLWFGEFPLMRKDGSHLTAFLSLGRVFDANHRVVCTLGVISDVTERVLLRDQLIQAQKMETVGTLASGIAHDFNNLLTAISGFAALLKESLAPGTDDHDSALSIEQAAQRGTQLVKQLVAFSHRQPTRTEPVDLNAIVREVADLIGRTFPRTIELETHLTPDLAMIRGDPNQMHQVIMNLAINARDAMPKGGRLTLATENFICHPDDPRAAGMKYGPCVCLSVADTGSGIPLDAQPHIFEPFFTTKSPAIGTGLGLSTVYAIVRCHKGTVTFTSEVDRGTTLYVVLPAMAMRPSPWSTPRTPQPTGVR